MAKNKKGDDVHEGDHVMVHGTVKHVCCDGNVVVESHDGHTLLVDACCLEPCDHKPAK